MRTIAGDKHLNTYCVKYFINDRGELSGMDAKELEKLHMLQLKIVREIKRICIEYNIKFFLEWGSMLGAVRHQGFIPWDDDMDIGMLASDYKKFLEVAPQALGKEFFIDYYPQNPQCGIVYAKVCLKNTIYMEGLSANDMENAIFVDIFPYFFRAEGIRARKIEDVKLIVLSQIFMAQSGMKVWIYSHGLSKIKFIPIRMCSKLFDKKTIYKKIQKIYTKHKEGSYLGVLGGTACEYAYSYPYDCFDEIIEVMFGDDYFPIPKRYDEILKINYGNYMALPPENKRTMHDIFKLDFGPYND